jgi:hypothetical protein
VDENACAQSMPHAFSLPVAASVSEVRHCLESFPEISHCPRRLRDHFLSMPSIAESFRYMCGSNRRPPEYRKQRIPAATPHLGHATEDNRYVVSDFFFSWTEYVNTNRKSVPFWTFYNSYPVRKRVRSKCLTSILPHPPRNTRLLAKSDGVADCGCSLERRCNA